MRSLFGGINCVSLGYAEGDWYFIVNPTDLDLGYVDDLCLMTGHALRFLNIDIPPGQVIKYAFITYFAWGTRYGEDCYGRIMGEKSLFPAAFTTWADFCGRPRTLNRIPWNKIPPWEHLGVYQTPNIAPIIQEIITQPGWVSGNPIVLTIEDLQERSSHVTLANRHAWAYYEHYEWTPILTIEYGPETHFAVQGIIYNPLKDSVLITLPTQIPCHLTCYYTDKKPVRHATTRVLRGLALPWGAYWCFVAWKSVEQWEAGDTLTHTFEVPDWSYCQTRWFTFRGTSIDVVSPSVGPLFQYHHPGQAPLQKFEFYDHPRPTYSNIYEPNRSGQTFRPTEYHLLTEVFTFMTRASNTYPTLNLYIKEAPNDVPTGPVLSTGQTPWALIPDGAVPAWIETKMSRCFLKPATKYALIAHTSFVGQGILRWRYRSFDADYPRGLRIHSSDSGGTWSKFPVHDFLFQEWGIPLKGGD
jgi:hypothetical protein